MWKWLCIVSLWLLASLSGRAQHVPGKITIPEYIERYRDIAIKKRMEHGIPASITLAQGILESANGNSELALMANNHFGIKCHQDWTGEGYLKDDDEKKECFRKYQYPEQSFEDHSRFLRTRSRYAFLFGYDPADYKSWAYGLKKAGYATNPNYAEQLIRIIEENGLARYDYLQQLPGTVGSVMKDRPPPRETRKVKEEGDYGAITLASGRRTTGRINGVKYTRAKTGDDLVGMAKELEMMTWQLLRYNELDRHARLAEGQVVFLQPKKRKASVAFHRVMAGETMHSISQLYGVKVRHLYKKNRMPPGTEPREGQRLWLRKKKPEDPGARSG